MILLLTVLATVGVHGGALAVVHHRATLRAGIAAST